MRMLALLTAFTLFASPALTSVAQADGIERPRPRVTRRAPPPPAVELLGAPEAPAPVESNLVSLPDSFFAGGGGVGADIGGGSFSSTTVIIRGGSASASAFAFASARAGAGARVGGRFGGGGHACCR